MTVGGASRRLCILLIAYEFPPSPSPQSLRWAYLAGRLAERGHAVHVMAPDLGPPAAGLPTPGPDVCVHPVAPGPVRALLGWLARRRPLVRRDASGSGNAAVAVDPFAGLGPVEPPRLNWKGRLLLRLQTIASWLLFPDLRGEWGRPARRALPGLLSRIQPDVVITSHEPATTLPLGLEARRCGLRWVADLGDPVLAPYTPARWRRRARRLERAVLAQADHVLVTTEETAALLRARHAGAAPLTVVPQGFDERLLPDRPCANRPGGATLELLYAGSFYAFRDPRPLVDGLLQVPGVRLNIASGNAPDWLFPLAERHPDQLRLLGRVPHDRLLALQRQVDVLVNIANADPAQIPGKTFEYLGACRPVLHVQSAEADAVGRLLAAMRRGWVCSGSPSAVAAQLRVLRERADQGRLLEGLELAPGEVQAWSWSAIAENVEAVLLSLVERHRAAAGGGGQW